MGGVEYEIKSIAPLFCVENTYTVITVVWGAGVDLEEADILGVKVCGIDHTNTVQILDGNRMQVTLAKTSLSKHPNCVPLGNLLLHNEPESGMEKTELVSKKRSGIRGSVSVQVKNIGLVESSDLFTIYEDRDEPDLETDDECDEWVEINGTSAMGSSGMGTDIVLEKAVDPLGLRGELEGLESSMSELQREALRIEYPDASADLFSAYFNPAWYLVEHHAHASFDQLTVGYTRLLNTIQEDNNENRRIIRKNLDRYFGAQEVFERLKDSVSNDPANQNNRVNQDMKVPIKGQMTMLYNRETQLLGHVEPLITELAAKTEAVNKSESFLNSVNAYKRIFYLPQQLNYFLQKSQYDLFYELYTQYTRDLTSGELYKRTNTPQSASHTHNNNSRTNTEGPGHISNELNTCFKLIEKEIVLLFTRFMHKLESKLGDTTVSDKEKIDCVHYLVDLKVIDPVFAYLKDLHNSGMKSLDGNNTSENEDEHNKDTHSTMKQYERSSKRVLDTFTSVYTQYIRVHQLCFAAIKKSSNLVGLSSKHGSIGSPMGGNATAASSLLVGNIGTLSRNRRKTSFITSNTELNKPDPRLKLSEQRIRDLETQFKVTWYTYFNTDSLQNKSYIYSRNILESIINCYKMMSIRFLEMSSIAAYQDTNCSYMLVFKKLESEFRIHIISKVIKLFLVKEIRLLNYSSVHSSHYNFIDILLSIFYKYYDIAREVSLFNTKYAELDAFATTISTEECLKSLSVDDSLIIESLDELNGYLHVTIEEFTTNLLFKDNHNGRREKISFITSDLQKADNDESSSTNVLNLNLDLTLIVILQFLNKRVTEVGIVMKLKTCMRAESIESVSLFIQDKINTLQSFFIENRLKKIKYLITAYSRLSSGKLIECEWLSPLYFILLDVHGNLNGVDLELCNNTIMSFLTYALEIIEAQINRLFRLDSEPMNDPVRLEHGIVNSLNALNLWFSKSHPDLSRLICSTLPRLFASMPTKLGLSQDHVDSTMDDIDRLHAKYIF